MTELLLLGAGASYDADVPTAIPMVGKVLGMLQANASHGDVYMAQYVKVVELAIELIKKHRRGFGETDPQVNIEELYNCLAAFSVRKISPLSPFIESWEHEFDSLITNPEDEKIHPSIRRTVVDNTRNAIRRALKDLTWVPTTEASRVRYWDPLVKLLAKQPRLVVATLNYDNVLELWADSVPLGPVSCTQGIENWTTQQQLAFTMDGVQLLKLHGSIDWGAIQEFSTPNRIGNTSDNFTRLPATDMDRLPPFVTPAIPVDPMTLAPGDPAHRFHSPLLIFGGENKLQAPGPFLALLEAFREELQQADIVTVIGYSFADPHINLLLSRWSVQKPNGILRIVAPAIGEEINRAVSHTTDMGGLMFVGDGSYKMEIGRFQDRYPTRVELLNMGAKTALDQLYR